MNVSASFYTNEKEHMMAVVALCPFALHNGEKTVLQN